MKPLWVSEIMLKISNYKFLKSMLPYTIQFLLFYSSLFSYAFYQLVFESSSCFSEIS